MNNISECDHDFRIVRYIDDFEIAWDEFVIDNSKNSTFLHTRKFFKHNEANNENDYSFLFYKKNKLIALLPATAYLESENKVFNSHQRSTYGGFVLSKDIAVTDFDFIIQLLIDLLISEGFNEVVIRPSFSIYHTELSNEQEYLLWKNRFEIKTRELELAINLKEDIELEYSDSTKRNIKKAKKNEITVEESNDLDSYWVIVEKNLLKFSKQPVHSVNDIKRLRELVGDNCVRLFCAKHKGKIIAGILAFVANSNVLHAQYIASDNDFQELRPLNAVIDYIAKQAQQESFKYFNLGMVTEPGGVDLNEGLCKFKEGFGAKGVLRETMHLIL